MAFFDLPLAELNHFQSAEPEPGDFDAFWNDTLAHAGRFPLQAKFDCIENPIYKIVNVYDVSFAGFGGQVVKGWMIEPAGPSAKRPCIVSFIGYGGGRGLPLEHLSPAMSGLAHFVCDTRGQGSSWALGSTQDQGITGPAHPGYMTRGIESRDNYYYRRVFTDASRAVEAAKAFPNVDPARIAVSGTSQGGGMAIAAAGLQKGNVKLLLSDVPFLCHYRRATAIVDTPPYNEITKYLKVHRGTEEQVFKTLSYFDAVHFAKRVSARTLFSVALMDVTCPPSTVFAAYNNIKAQKQIEVYHYNDHEGGGPVQAEARLAFCAKHL